MEKQDKEILIRFMCECQPYGMNCDVHGRVRVLRYVDTKKGTACFESKFGVGYVPQEYPIEEVKPFVRPLKSLTDDEFSEIKSTLISTPSNIEESLAMIDKWILFVRRKHIDYLGLLEKGLGVSTEAFNPYD